MNIGIICPSQIALNRFLPSLSKIKSMCFCGVGCESKEDRIWENEITEAEKEEVMKNHRQKAQNMVDMYGGKVYESFDALLADPKVEAIYIPLPPALHFTWAKRTLLAGKHVLVEKPSTISYKDALELTDIAEKKGLVIYENYMFIYHSQMDVIKRIIDDDKIGQVKLFRASFGFPRRAANDFRYNGDLGGGALLDAGGYTIRIARFLLGDEAKLSQASLQFIDDFSVDIFGAGTLVNEEHIPCQISFGMDNDYKCDLEIWGSKGTLETNRIFTAPDGYEAVIRIKNNGETKEIKVPGDDAFYNSILHFEKCTKDDELRKSTYKDIKNQARLVEEFRDLALKN